MGWPARALAFLAAISTPVLAADDFINIMNVTRMRGRTTGVDKPALLGLAYPLRPALVLQTLWKNRRDRV